MKKYIPLKESLNLDDLYLIDKYLESKLNLKNFKKTDRKSVEGHEISYYYQNRESNIYYYTISLHEHINEIRLNFIEELIIIGDSLADPRAAYQTTSARYFKKKKRKLDKFYIDINKIKKDIDKFFQK